MYQEGHKNKGKQCFKSQIVWGCTNTETQITMHVYVLLLWYTIMLIVLNLATFSAEAVLILINATPKINRLNRGNS